MATNFADAFLSARNNAQDRVRQQGIDAQANQMRQFQMQEAQTKSRGSQQEALYGLAKGYKDYLSQNPQGGQQYYERFLAPSLRGLGLGDPGPYNEPEAISLADQVLSAYMPQATQTALAPRVVGDALVDSTGKVLYQSPQEAPKPIWDSARGVFIQQPGAMGQQVTQQDMEGDIALANELIASGVPEAQVDAFLKSRGQRQGPIAQGGPAAIPVAGIGPKAPNVPAGYQTNPDGSMSAIPGGPADVARQARQDAAAARKAAEEVKASQKIQENQARKAASDEAATGLINAIDQLTTSPGFSSLGTAWGDAQIATPWIRNDAKDAQAQLKNVAGQVALAALARLKSLSSTGATGFGSLTKPELDLVQNSIATLQSEDISNAELTRSLKIIRDAMQKTVDWQDSPAPDSGGVARPSTDAEYNALPSGALFIDPDDGKQYRKP